MRSRIRDRASSLARALAQPAGDQLEDLLTPEVIEGLVVSALEQVELAHRSGLVMELLAAGGIDQSVSRSGKDQEGDLDLAGVSEDRSGRGLPLGAEAGRDLVVHERVVAISLDHLRNP